MKSILSLICLLSFATILNAQKAGTLDSSFGTNGKVKTSFGSNTYPTINKASIQTDDKIIEVGNYGTSNFGEATGFLAVRYNGDGTLDYNFGDSGKSVIQFPFEDYAEVHAVAVQFDGKILLSGYGWQDYRSPLASGIIARINTNGLLDSSFGEDGVIRTTPNKLGGSYGSIEVQADNKFVVIGGTNGSSFINRFLKDGTLDRTFGDTGYIYTSLSFVSQTCKIQQDGKILIGGYYYNTNIFDSKFCLQRYMPDGTIDNSFGSNGTITTNYGKDGSWINDLDFQSDGKIIATGVTGVYSSFDSTFFATARYNVDGRLDSTFGINGEATTRFGDSICQAQSVDVQKDDKILVGGFKGNSIAEYALVRLTSDGVRDSAFGYNGESTPDFGYASSIKSVLIQTTGKIVAAGSYNDSTIPYCALARYDNDDETKKQKIISKIKHYIQNHNNLESSSTADANAVTFNITIAPNPVNSMLTIKGLSGSTKYAVRITNESGNTVVNKQISNVPSYQINVQGLSAGVYYVNLISNNNQSTTLKFIKQ